MDYNRHPHTLAHNNRSFAHIIVCGGQLNCGYSERDSIRSMKDSESKSHSHVTDMAREQGACPYLRHTRWRSSCGTHMIEASRPFAKYGFTPSKWLKIILFVSQAVDDCVDNQSQYTAAKLFTNLTSGTMQKPRAWLYAKHGAEGGTLGTNLFRGARHPDQRT